MVFGALGRLFGRIRQGLAKTRSVLGDALRGMFGAGRRIERDFLDDLEFQLVAADIGPAKAEEIVAEVQARWRSGELAPGTELMDLIRASLRRELDEGGEAGLNWASSGPTVMLVIGVNGTGKTTSIAKLAKRFRDQGRTVLLGAGDTYRAAAVEQLSIWAERVGVDIISQGEGADPAAVAFDAVAAAQARQTEVLLVDTAGRLHNKEHLMRELEKVRRVMQKRLPEAPHETLLVLDATSGQNAIQQAKAFGAAMGVTGLILSKLDGTAKGGVAVTIKRELGLPIRYIGVGESMDDLQPFDPETFIDGILGGPDDEAGAA